MVARQGGNSWLSISYVLFNFKSSKVYEGERRRVQERVSTEETVKPGTTAGEAFEHDLDDKLNEK